MRTCKIVLLGAIICCLAMSSCTKELIQEELKNVSGIQTFLLRDDNLIIASKFMGDHKFDIVQDWRYCLQGGLNTIFSFYSVEKIANDSNVPKVKKPILGRGIKTIMSQSSDCILAARINKAADFSGASEYCSGNHALLFEGKKYKTAETVAVEVYADGSLVNCRDEEGYAKEIIVKVTTNVYDPFILIESLKIDASKPKYHAIIEEIILYTVIEGNIICDVTRNYLGPVNLEAYGGFASMAMTLDYGYFPCGANMNNPDWDAFGKLDSNIGFDHECDKKLCPDFNHFIRRDSRGEVFESVFLFEDNQGDHSEIPDDYSMYWVYNAVGTHNKKIYHRISFHINYFSGDQQKMKCMYSWFRPIANTPDYICYEASGFLFIDFKSPFNGTIPIVGNELVGNYTVYKQTKSIISSVLSQDNDTIDVLTEGKGMVILIRD